MRALIALSVLLIAGVFGLILVLGLFGIVDLPYLYVDIAGITQGVRYEIYTSTRNSLQLKHPQSWSILERLEDDRVDFFSYDENGRIAAGLYFIVQDIEAGETYEALAEAEVERISKEIPEYKQEDLRETVLAENNALQLTYTGLVNSGNYRRIGYLFANSGKFYKVTIQLDIDSEDYQSLESITASMISSIRLIDTIQP